MIQDKQEEYLDELVRLAGVTKKTASGLNESAQKGYRSVVSKTRDDKGKYYALVKEGNKFYIKESLENWNDNVDCMNYVGGYDKRKIYESNSYSDANRKFVYFLQNKPNQNFIIKEENNISNETGLLTEQTTPEVAPPAPTPPSTGDTTSTVAAPSGEMPDMSGEEVVEPTSEPSDEMSSDDSDLEDEFGEDEMVDSLLGKLTYELRNVELTPDKTKSILNSVIAALDLSKIPDDERLKIAKRVKRGKSKDVKAYEVAGKKEGESDETTSMKPSNMEETTHKKDEKLKESKIYNELLYLIESKFS